MRERATIGIWGLFSGRGSGIGKLLAEHFSSSGHTIVGIGRDFGKCKLRGVGKKVAVDIESQSYSANDLVSQIGKLDVLVVTAGVGYANPIWDIDLSKITEMAKANFILPVWIVSAALRVTNHIILTGSIAGVQPREGSSVYSGTKSAVISFAESARKELSDHYIQTINFNNIHRVGPEKVMRTYEFMIDTPCNMDITINI